MNITKRVILYLWAVSMVLGRALSETFARLYTNDENTTQSIACGAVYFLLWRALLHLYVPRK